MVLKVILAKSTQAMSRVFQLSKTLQPQPYMELVPHLVLFWSPLRLEKAMMQQGKEPGLQFDTVADSAGRQTPTVQIMRTVVIGLSILPTYLPELKTVKIS